MVAITEQAVWAEQIRQIEANDPVQGGENGIDNIPHQQLANRTAYLKREVEAVHKKVSGIVMPADNSEYLQQLEQRLKTLEDRPAPTIKQYMIPVGGLFETTKDYADSNAVANDVGYGTWERYGEGRVTVAESSEYTLGQEGGEDEVTLTEAQMPSHKHDVYLADAVTSGESPTISAGGGTVSEASLKDNASLQTAGGNQPHNNMQPFVVVGRWVRTA